ncbi:MAG: hypothetical protein A2539_06450 [Elusimicrobia bacterium RIFOXYD2_FULL_34_15]|nr:MAG: hypothetical protein A2539_06450 [Elusimicrobia bacterium RIFOXYD2_FULL_34_15]
MEPLTTFQISKLLHVDISTVIDWIDSGKIPAYKTPGGHRRIEINDLIDFLKKYKMPIPEELNATGNIQKTQNNIKKILIVDDEEGILKFISIVIKKFFKDVDIELASDGFVAGRKIAEFKPDLIILDIRLPGMDGFEVLKELKKEKMKIIIITAFASKEMKEKIIKSGAEGYLIKPFTAEELKQKIENLI